MKPSRVTALVALVAAILTVATVVALRGEEQEFPHLQHERLFPVCEGCHAGIATGVAATSFPAPTVCAQCHDGVRAVPVQWRERTPRQSNLLFSHPDHYERTRVSGDAVTCQSCHLAGEPQTRMNVSPASPMRCIECHAHAADTHPSPAVQCSTCHVPLASAPLSAARVAAIQQPAWHDSADFPFTHGSDILPRAASCATCHARESCERCHANADQLPAVLALPRDSRVAELVSGREGSYPAPSSHMNAAWRMTHGTVALNSSLSCANCHTRPSCLACHIEGEGSSVAVIASLPDAVPGRAAGVAVDRITVDIHPADIAQRHGSLAATGRLACAECHNTQTCATCHSAPDSRRFHIANFVARHATDVFARSTDCQACHSTEAFCRDCHVRTGVAASSSMSAAFHTGLPNWVLSHGQAARRGIESCASCHKQSDCIRCHSAVGGWRVNPHGASFPANRTAIRNASSCSWCHLGGVQGGG